MIVPQELPRPPSQVFMLATPAHMLIKLHWEIYGLRKALSEAPEHLGHVHAPSYCAFNCAITAWHLADWVWKSSPPALRANILADLGVEVRGQGPVGLTEFQNGLRDRSRALHICRQVATGSKHMIVRDHPDPHVRAEMRWEREPARAGKMRAGDALATFRCQLVISDQGAEQPAIDVFETAFRDWERLLGRWGFVEGGKFVPARSG
jgi:hypothetical protein